MSARRALALVLAAAAPSAAAPGAAAASRGPSIAAPAAIVIDARTGERLYSRNADSRRAIASTTKLMTAMVVLARTRPGDVFAMPHYAVGAAESKIGLRTGERMTVHDLLRAMMLPSANDAAYDLAVNVGGSRAAFVRLMNERARALGLTETHYSTPVGLDDPRNYSSARDLARLAALLMRNPTFATVVALPSARLRSGSHPRTVVNRNTLVRRYPFVNGVKTGHTLRAGYALVGAAGRGGAEVVSVELGDSSEGARDADSLALLRFGLGQFRRVRPVVAGRVYAHAAVRWHDGNKVDLVAARGASLTVRRGAQVSRRVKAPSELSGPLPRGRRVGSLEVVYRGRVAASVPLVTASPVQGAGIARRVISSVGGLPLALAFLALAGALLVLAGRRIRATRFVGGEGAAR